MPHGDLDATSRTACRDTLATRSFAVACAGGAGSAASFDLGRPTGIAYVGCPATDREVQTGARPSLENSTACQKSVPRPHAGGHFGGCMHGLMAMTDEQLVSFSDNRQVQSWLVRSHGFSVSIARLTGRLSIDINGEFDPGSGRTLAACLTHASRARPCLRAGVLAANG